MEISLAPAKLLAATVLVLASLILPASALAAPIVISPDPLVAPTTTVGSQGDWLEIDIAYAGNGGVTIDTISLAGEEADEFVYGGYECETLTEGMHCIARVALKPTSAGEKRATFEATFNGGTPMSREISGTATEPSLSFDPASIDFGTVWTGRGGYVYIQLRNTGTAPIELENLGFQGPDPGNFSVGDNGCMGPYGATMDPGAECSVQIIFQPWDIRSYQATFVARASGVEYSAALSGEGGYAELTPETNPVDLGSATVGTRGEVRTITLTNHGNLPASFFIALVAGGDTGSFELVAEDCSTRGTEPGESCTAQVRFRPASAGLKNARLMLFGEGSTSMVFLQGVGEPAAVALSAPSFDLGDQQVGTRGSARAVVVSNEGAAPVTVEQVRLAGLDPDQFVLAGDECSDATLQPGAVCAVRVRFAPDSTGPKAARLRVSGDFGSVSAAVAGTGTVAPADVAASTASPSTADPAVKPRPRPFSRNKTIRAPKRAKASRSKGHRQSRSSTRSGVRGNS